MVSTSDPTLTATAETEDAHSDAPSPTYGAATETDASEADDKSDASGEINWYSTERYCKLTKYQIDEHEVLLRVRIL